MRKYILVIGASPEASAYIRRHLEDATTEIVYSISSEDAVYQLLLRRFLLIIVEQSFVTQDSADLFRLMKRQSPAPIMVIYANADIPDERGNVCLTPFADTETKLDISGWAMRVKAHIEHYAPAIESDRSYILAHGHDLVINLAERTVSLYDEELLLSQKQFDILCYLASHPGQVLSKSQIFNYLWEEQANETDNCVTLQISKLRKKLGDTPNAQEYIQTVRGVGYKFAK